LEGLAVVPPPADAEPGGDGPGAIPDGHDQDGGDDETRVAAATRKSARPHTGQENDDGEALFDRLANAKGLSLAATTLIKASWAPETFRKMRHSWKLLSDFLTHERLVAEDLLSDRASVIAANFKASTLSGPVNATVNATLSHTNVLLSTFSKDGSNMHSLISRAAHRKRPRKGRKYRTMWDIRELLRFISQELGTNAGLTEEQLLVKCLALTMVYSAARLAELARMTVDQSHETKAALRVETNIKTALDTRESITFYPVRNKSICPHAALSEWLRRRPTSRQLFTDPRTQKPLTETAIAGLLRRLMSSAGISDEYGAYSIKHAVITFLFDGGAGEAQINEFGRWSYASRVASGYYRVATPQRDWLGFKIAEGAGL
jgi:site-specific recombinase XerD